MVGAGGDDEAVAEIGRSLASVTESPSVGNILFSTAPHDNNAGRDTEGLNGAAEWERRWGHLIGRLCGVG